MINMVKIVSSMNDCIHFFVVTLDFLPPMVTDEIFDLEYRLRLVLASRSQMHCSGDGYPEKPEDRLAHNLGVV